MADRLINGEMLTATKVHSGSCSKCNKRSGVLWMISKVNSWDRLAAYCYSCTGNHWAKAFKLHKEHLASNEASCK